MGKTLIAYYSRKGQNYVNGSIISLPIGNTEVVAKKIQAISGDDLFFIDMVKNYPMDYTETTNVAKKELKEGARPELTATVDNFNNYDTIYLGYPNWWGTFPMAVFTFLESYDFSGITIIPFCTHEGSGLGKSMRNIQRLCPGVNVKNGLAIVGSSVKTSNAQIKNWIQKL